MKHTAKEYLDAVDFMKRSYESYNCLLYTSDAADEEDSVDLGGRRIIKKNIAKDKPTSVVILFIVLLTFLFQPPSNSKKPMIIILVTD